MKHNINKIFTKAILGIVILSSLNNNITKAQTFAMKRDGFFAVNVLTGGIIGGIGSMVHKKQNQKLHKAFLSGFIKGCVGGSLTFTGKYMVYGIKSQESYWLGWPAKLVHAAGASIMENATRNAPLYDNWAIDYGALRVDVNYKGKSQVRIQPSATLGILFSVVDGNKFDVGTTIKIGTPYFTYHDNSYLTNSTGSYVVAYTVVNSISMNTGMYQTPDNNIYNASGHELIHAFQYRESLSISCLFLKNKNKWFYIDTPNFIANRAVASLINPKQYYSNYFENEAETLSRRIGGSLK